MMIAGRYRLDQPIGRGGMGEVWSATDTRLRRKVAVKLISDREKPDEQLRKRFERESRLTAQLDHPGVPVVYDSGVEDDRLYLVMQLIDGVNLDLLGDDGEPVPLGWAAAVGAQVAAVLHHAHQRVVIHRDLKPSNLMLTPDGSVKVLDFGLAKALADPNQSKLTATDQYLGTWLYMAPEQFSSGSIGPWTDLYALGCVLHHLLAGGPLFGGRSEHQTMYGHLTERPAPLRSLRPEVPEELDALVLHLLEKEPKDRPADAQLVYQRLLPHATGLSEFPGAVKRGTSATRMYATVVARVTGEPAAVQQHAAEQQAAEQPEAEQKKVHSDLSQTRRTASRMFRESKTEEAVELLDAAARKAESVLGHQHSDVFEIRLELADLLFNCGNFPQAGAAYSLLARDVARRDGQDADLVLTCRFREAGCYAAFGETTLALSKLQQLAGDSIRVYGPDDNRTLELRRQIGLLLHTAGQQTEAMAVLRRLIQDFERLYGTGHGLVTGLRADLVKMA
jgi:serine/threonine protein kinase